MSDNDNKKNQLVSSPQVAGMLKLSQEDEHASQSEHSHAASDLPVANLPVVQAHSNIHASSSQAADSKGFSKIVGNLYMKDVKDDQTGKEGHGGGDNHGSEHQQLAAPAPGNPMVKFFKAVVPYIVIFSLAVFIYFFFFSNVNLGDYFHVKAQPATPKETALQQVESQSMAGYQAWISQFYFDVSDSKLIDPEADNSGNGLTNFQKYLLNLNPKSYDTLGLGMADSEALAKNLNPLTGTPLNDDQKSIINKYFDME